MPTSTRTCCPPDPSPNGLPWVYVDTTGYYRNPTNYGKVQVLNYAGGASLSLVYNKCVHVQASNAFGETANPIDCPCCPDYGGSNPLFTYYYNQYNDLCMPNIINGLYIANVPVPCITCVCLDLPDPTCPTCGSGGEHTAFTWDFTRAHCSTCIAPQEENNPCGSIQDFLPVQYLDPITANFRLRIGNKTFL